MPLFELNTNDATILPLPAGYAGFAKLTPSPHDAAVSAGGVVRLTISAGVHATLAEPLTLFPVLPMVSVRAVPQLAVVMFADPLKLVPLIVRAVVSVAADPVVFWLPAVFTPGKLMLAVPLKLTPPMVRAVWSAVAVAAFPVVL
jgi:hypothetical protein